MSGESLNPDDLTNDFIPKRRESAATIEIDNECVVFDEDRGSWHHMNPMARVIWDCCDGSGSVEEIARDISEIFEQDLGKVEETVLETLSRFGQQGLLDGVEQTASADGHGHIHDHEHQHQAEEPRFVAVPPSS